MLFIISSLLISGTLLEKIFKFLFIIFFDLNKGPNEQNKKEKNFLLKFKPRILPIKKKK